jgi:hypothetical protein
MSTNGKAVKTTKARAHLCEKVAHVALCGPLLGKFILVTASVVSRWIVESLH